MIASKGLRTARIIALLALLLLTAVLCACGAVNDLGPDSSISISDRAGEPLTEQDDGSQITGEGTVARLLSDDTSGDRHQRFIIELSDGQTLLVAHNIDIAPRLDGLAVGDTVQFNGEYFFNKQGGGIHWTHASQNGRHADGWLYWEGNYFQ